MCEVIGTQWCNRESTASSLTGSGKIMRTMPFALKDECECSREKRVEEERECVTAWKSKMASHLCVLSVNFVCVESGRGLEVEGRERDEWPR